MTYPFSSISAHLLFCDGSYNKNGSKSIGIGVVKINNEPMKPDVYSEKIIDTSPFKSEQQNTNIAEMAAILLAMQKVPDGKNAVIFNDNLMIIRSLENGDKLRDTNNIIDELQSLILDEYGRLGGIKILHPSKLFGICQQMSMKEVDLYDRLAHNAAIYASGSLNWKETQPGYEGAYGYQLLHRRPIPREDPFAGLATLSSDNFSMPNPT